MPDVPTEPLAPPPVEGEVLPADEPAVPPLIEPDVPPLIEGDVVLLEPEVLPPADGAALLVEPEAPPLTDGAGALPLGYAVEAREPGETEPGGQSVCPCCPWVTPGVDVPEVCASAIGTSATTAASATARNE